MYAKSTFLNSTLILRQILDWFLLYQAAIMRILLPTMEGLHGVLSLQASLSKISALYRCSASRPAYDCKTRNIGIHSPFLF